MKNKQLALEEMAKDCQVRGVYLTPQGETCAVGRLAQLAGVDEETLLAAGSAGVTYQHSYIDRITKAIHDKFGLSLPELRAIQSANDEPFHTQVSRVEAVLKVVQAIPEDPV